MSYLGSSAAPIPVAFSGVRTQSFNGTGSASLFTLSRQVNAVTDIEVIVNNVQQSPFDGSYSIVSNGLGLQFSENPSAGTNNIYVVYRDQPMGSLSDTSAVKLTGNQTIGGDKTFTGAVIIKRVNAINEGGQIDLCRSTDNAPAWAIDVFGSTSTPALRVVDNTAGATRMQIDGSGRVTIPNQVAFFAHKNSGTSNPSGTVIQFSEAPVNKGACFNTSTYRFTAPIAGTYALHAKIQFAGGGTPNYYLGAAIRINDTQYQQSYTSQYVANAHTCAVLAAIVTLSAGDYVDVVNASFSQGQPDTQGSSDKRSIFMGHLIG